MFILAFARSPLAADIVTLPYEVVREVGHELTVPLSLPTDVAVDNKGNLYVVDSGNDRVVILDPSGRSLGSLGADGTGDHELNGPVGIDITPTGAVYVADRGNHRLVQYLPNGTEHRAIPLTVNGDAVEPVDVAVAYGGMELFVTASGQHRVLVYASDGTFLRDWGGEGSELGEFRYPATLTLFDDMVYIVDVLNARVQVFDRNGNSLRSFGKLGAGAGTFFRPKGIAVDASGRIYVTDSYLGVVQQFSGDGSFLSVLGQQGVATQFDNPVGLVAREGRLLIVQMLPGRVVELMLGLEQ